ncbi:alpha/beta hydrolase [Nocardioides sp. GY 10113]|uniref:alpha/beta hydrolase n=1 Tax=Nocardioides sp. GY 10113 TaxID=2569761 RepID=UPI0010A93120|nr:alpha/beta hydrolase [Nocardioides sp. GY 10113]TIC88088.1 alpha/beta hydrolase [Nocardioides sp. GY 10113]
MNDSAPTDRTGDPATPDLAPAWWRWLVLAVAAAGLLVVAWACLTEWGGVVHGHPAYAVLLAVTALGGLLVVWRARRALPRRRGWRRALGIALLVAGVAWVAAVAWLRPLSAVEPALGAMRSDAAVTVTESATRIELSPTGGTSPTGVFFQPGAKVDPRAYAAVLRPLAEAGHTVVITKQPLSIAFLSVGAFDGARGDYPDVERWVVGGHSLGGVVAAIEADDADEDADAPAVGLLLYASYPAEDVSDSLSTAVASISGSRDGLSTPERIEESRADLPADADFTVVDGAAHAFFGDYGTQPGDGTPTISQDAARQQISAASVEFVDGIDEALGD